MTDEDQKNYGHYEGDPITSLTIKLHMRNTEQFLRERSGQNDRVAFILVGETIVESFQKDDGEVHVEETVRVDYMFRWPHDDTIMLVSEAERHRAKEAEKRDAIAGKLPFPRGEY